MKNISSELKLPENGQQQITSYRNKILGNEEIKSFISENNLTADIVNKSILKFGEYLEKKSLINGYRPILQLIQGWPVVTYQKSDEQVRKELVYNTTGTLSRESIVTDNRIQSATFDNFTTENEKEEQVLKLAMNHAVQYKAGRNGNLVLQGKAGAGKSHLAHAIAEFVNKDDTKKVLFISVLELFNKFNSYREFSERQRVVNKYDELLKNVYLLVLDDLGAETGRNKQATDYTERFLSGLLEARNRTIITTNFSGDELKMMYGRRMISRMLKGTGNIENAVCNFDGIRDKRRLGY